MLINRLDPVVADRNAVDVGREVFQHGLAIADRFDIDDPLLLEHTVRHGTVEPRLFHLLGEQLLIQPGRTAMVKQKSLGVCNHRLPLRLTPPPGTTK